MLQQHSADTNTHKTKHMLIAVLAVVGFAAAGLVAAPIVQAATLQEQINSLNQQNSAKRSDLGQLGSEAASLQDTVARLAAEIANLQEQIVASEAKREATVAEIANAEAELARQKATLSDNLKKMYVSGQMSTLEELASSQDLAQFADSEQYNVTVQRQIQQTLVTIKELQAKLATEKANLERMIASLRDMRGRVASQRAEQARLLALNHAQQTELDGQIKANSGRIAELQRQQAAENARAFGTQGVGGTVGGGGYPWGHVSYPSSQIDPWGMYKRECVSYTAWKVSSTGRYMPYWGGRGNAKQWDDNARAAGMNVTSTPSPQTVAVSNAGTWGHVMWVEQVGGDGSIYVSDYNQQFDGRYRAYWISADRVAAKSLVFIHF